MCDGLHGLRYEEPSVLERFLRRQCCRMVDEQLAWTHQKAAERLQSAAAKQERQFQSMRRAFDLKEQECVAELQALKLRCQEHQLRAVHRVVSSLEQAKLGHLMHFIFLRWASVAEARLAKETDVKKPRAKDSAESPSKTINAQQVLMLPTPQRRKPKQGESSARSNPQEASGSTSCIGAEQKGAAGENMRFKVIKPHPSTCSFAGSSMSWQPAGLMCDTSRTIFNGLPRSTSGSLCVAPAASLRPALRLVSPSPLRLARPQTFGSSIPTRSVTPVPASYAGRVPATSRTVRSVSCTVQSRVTLWPSGLVRREAQMVLPGQARPLACARLQGERPAGIPCTSISFAGKLNDN